MAMLDDIGTYIAANTSLTLGTDLFLGLMPDDPGNVVAIYENGGATPVSTMGGASLPVMERPELQVIVRNATYATGRSTAETLYQLLTQVAGQTLTSTLYHRIEAISAPAVFDRDQNRRVLFTTNFTVLKDL